MAEQTCPKSRGNTDLHGDLCFTAAILLLWVAGGCWSLRRTVPKKFHERTFTQKWSSKPKCGNYFLPSLVPIIVIYYSLFFTRQQRNWAVARGTVPVIDFNTLSLPLLRTAEVLSPPSARIDALLLGDRPPPVVCYYKICVVETKLKLSISSTTLASAVCGSWASPGPWNVWVPAGSLRFSTSVCSPGKLSQPPWGGCVGGATPSHPNWLYSRLGAEVPAVLHGLRMELHHRMEGFAAAPSPLVQAVEEELWWCSLP